MAAVASSQIEEVTDEPKDAKYYEGNIWEAIREYYLQEYDAETVAEIAKTSQNSFVAACEYARKCCINKCDLISTVAHKINEHCGGVAHNQYYVDDVIEILADVFLSICFRIDKVPSLFAFATLVGVDRSTLQNWANGVSSASRLGSKKQSVLKIRDARAESLQNVCISGGKGVVGSIAILNNTYWNNSYIPEERGRLLGADELPLLYPDFSLEDKKQDNVPVALPYLGSATGEEDAI